MPIKGLSDRGMAFPEIAQIRKGAPKEEGKIGRDLNYFRVEFAEGEQAAAQTFVTRYGQQPQEIDVLLPFNEIDRCWEAWLEAYTAGRMVARTDGEKFIYWVDTKTGEIKVKDGEPYTPYKDGMAVGSYTDSKNREVSVFCKPTGRLKVVLPVLARMAYATLVTTSAHDIQNISSQLDALWNINGGRIAGIPLKLRRRPKKISVPKPDGTRARMTKFMLSIEADPDWVKAKLMEVKKLALPGNGLALLPEPEISHAEPIEAEDGAEQGDYYEEEDDGDIPANPAMEDPSAPMDLSTAESVTGSDKKRYGDCSDKDLEGKEIGIKKALLKPNLSHEEKDTYQFKLDAIRTIQMARSGQLSIGGL